MKCGEWPGGPNYISGLFKPERSRVSLSIRPCKGSTMTSVTSFTRTPRGLPRDQWAPCRIEDTLRDETSSLLCGHLSVTQVSQKRRILYHLSLSSACPRPLSIIAEEIEHLFPLFSANRSEEDRSKIRRRNGEKERGFRTISKNCGARIASRFRVSSARCSFVERIGDDFIAAVSMPPPPPGARRRGVGVRKGEER